ncbi:MAG: winged helix-turn-helix domain-containing protein [Actinomycetota bacterium]
MEGGDPTGGTGASTIAFEDVVIDLGSYELYRDGALVSIEPQVFDVLLYLIEHRDRVIGKVELFDEVWGDRFVSESALTSRIKSARQAVGDDGRQQKIIRTTHGRGYRFVAELTAAGDDGADAQPQPQAQPQLQPPAAAPGEPRAAPRHSNVPAPARPLVARDRELTTLIELVSSNRLVTVVGPGGVGKTRLATELATQWDQHAGDTVAFVALATVTGPGEVLGVIRSSLGVGRGGTVEPISALREALAGTSVLVVLDNFEHVVDAAITLADLVESVPEVRLLVTSRERLGLAGEQVLELEPFSLAPDGSAESAAVTFFEHAVRGVRSDTDFDAGQRDDVTAICRTLDGLPLAMELAAAQTRYFSLSYLRSHLESAAITVADHARDRPERHHTMQSTIAWSYRLLSPSQQRLLASLSVFRSGWPLEAAAALSGVEDPGAAARDLLALVDKSLVQRSEGVLAEPRFSMLHLLRDFARSQLDAVGGRDDTLDRHATFLSDRMRVLEANRWGDAGDGWIDAIDAEYPDAVAALTWCFGGGDPAIGCQIVRSLGFWWYRSGRHGEGRVWVDHALANSTAADDPTMAWIHAAAGSLAKYELRRADCFEHFDRALTLARNIGDERLVALSLCDRGAATAGVPEEYEAGLASVQEGLDHARRLDTAPLIAHGLTVLGELTRANGHPDRAEAAYGEALELNVRTGDRHYEAINTLNMGHALMAQDRLDEALLYHRRGIELSTRIGSRIMTAWNLAALATAHHLLGRPRLAAQLVGASQATLEVLGATYGPVDQPIHERRQHSLRNDLGHDEYEQLVGDGRQWRLEEGIEVALEALDQAPS